MWIKKKLLYKSQSFDVICDVFETFTFREMFIIIGTFFFQFIPPKCLKAGFKPTQ